MSAASLFAMWELGVPSPWAALGGFALAVLFDTWRGELPTGVHPVVAMGTMIARLKSWALRGSATRQLLAGAGVVLFVVGGSAAAAWLSIRLCCHVLWLETVVCAYWIVSAFALKGLTDAAFVMERALHSGEIATARRGLGSLCSRDAARLNESQLAAGTLESISENASDSVVAPLFFLCAFGVPGMVAYRAANTLDAMLGYHGELEYAGKASARLDDVLNWLPARLTAALLLLAGLFLKLPVRRGFCAVRSDAGRTESPNAGYPMAALAGLLEVSLEKPGCYVLGPGLPAPNVRHLEPGVRLVRVACGLCFLLVFGVLAWRAC